MTVGKKIAAFFQMDEDTWKRHANPWSVWSRATVLPALILAAWSRVWIGWWALVPGVLALLWMWANPRVFGRPDSLDNWASKAVLGERVWIHRDEKSVPKHHRRVPHLLNTMNGVATLFTIWGVVTLQGWPMLFGVVLMYVAKFWYLDRMVWLYEDVQAARPDDERSGTWAEATDLTKGWG